MEMIKSFVELVNLINHERVVNPGWTDYAVDAKQESWPAALYIPTSLGDIVVTERQGMLWTEVPVCLEKFLELLCLVNGMSLDTLCGALGMIKYTDGSWEFKDYDAMRGPNKIYLAVKDIIAR